jgi:dephospho-CoA kinase
MIKELIQEVITEEQLDEKLLTYNNRSNYGQIVFLAGGAGSGKGFAGSHFIDSASFKVRDVDELKKSLQILNRFGKISIDTIVKKHGKNIKPKDLENINQVKADGYNLQNMNLKKPDHVYALHTLVKAMGIKEKTLEAMLMGKNNPEVLPNIMFDITAKDVTDITSIIPQLRKAGYNSKNIHLTWVLTNYVTAMQNNRERARMVPEDILLKTHEGAANTVWGLVTKAMPRGLNGRCDVILNNPQHTVFYKDADGNDVKGIAKGFLALPIKREGKGMVNEKVWKRLLFSWVKDNAPESITKYMK